MGIKGLKALLKKHAPGAFTEINKKCLKNKKIAIDSSILLYKFRYLIPTDNFHILGFIHKVLELLDIGIIPVFVFDGKPPDAKKEVLNKRNNTRTEMNDRLQFLKDELKKHNEPEETPDYIISSDNEEETDENIYIRKIKTEMKKIKKNTLYVYKKHSHEVMEMLNCIGIPFFHRPEGEAEEMCAFLQKRGYVDYILTEDTDALTFGGNNVIFTLKNEFILCKLETILKELDISYESFVDLCILCGCDYTQTVPKIGPVTALKLIKEYVIIENCISNSHDCNYELARSIFMKNNEFNNPEEQFEIKKINNIDQIQNLLSRYSIQENINLSKFI